MLPNRAKPIPTRLLLIRLARGLTQVDLAILAGVDSQQLARRERGEVSLPYGVRGDWVLPKLAAFLGEDPARLLDQITDLEQRVAAPWPADTEVEK